MSPNPFDNAERRHPVGSLRGAVISGTYGGGVFCRLKDDTNIMCLYTPQMFSEEFYKDDEVLIKITRYDYDHKMIYGKIMSRW